MSILKEKSFELALLIIALSEDLKSARDFVFADQVLKSGTSVGANIREAFGGHSRRDFLARLQISYKELMETIYWLDLLRESKKIRNDKFELISVKLVELQKILVATIKTTRASL